MIYSLTRIGLVSILVVTERSTRLEAGYFKAC